MPDILRTDPDPLNCPVINCLKITNEGFMFCSESMVAEFKIFIGEFIEVSRFHYARMLAGVLKHIFYNAISPSPMMKNLMLVR